MSIIGSNILAGASGQGGGYNLTRSLRFRSSADGRLSRTPSSTGNRQIFTWSGWVKRGALGSNQSIFSCYFAADNNSTFHLSFFSDDTLRVGLQTNYALITSQVFRDPSAWYHIVLQVDTTQATATNRMKLYLNGSQITSFSTNTLATNVSQNMNLAVNSANAHYYSYLNGLGWYLDGYVAETILVDGQALTPSSFGETSATTGVWQPKRYAGTYGTNGFYLPFTDNSALTTSSNVGLGKDFSGNGNYWTTNNISITSGATYDSMTDVPTLTSATASNFATLNPLLKPSVVTLSNANLTSSLTGAYNGFANWYINSGKYYWEVKVGNNPSVNGIGISPNPTFTTVFYTEANGVYYYGTGEKYVNGVGSAYGTAPSTNDIVGFALDYNANTLTCYLNNVSQGAITISSGQTWSPSFGSGNGGVTITNDWNFGQRPFAYTPPTGFVALNTFNLPTPTIGATASTRANKYFDATLYNGSASAQTITNSGSMPPDLVWIKARNTTTFNALIDSVRGGTKTLYSNATSAEGTFADAITSFNSNGFSVAANSTFNTINVSSDNYVAWQWRANGTPAITNTAGSITSTVSANTSSGFSVVTYTGNASVASFGHGLGVAPKMIIIKNRSASGSGSNWCVGVDIAGWNWATDYLYLNTTGAKATDGGTTQFYSAPTSTVVNIGGGTNTNGSGNSMVAYCFSEVAGYSKFGSYTGNGSTDGTFVHTGFRPRYVMIKRTDSTSSWAIFDTSRNTYNVTDNNLFANLSDAESTFTVLDILSNGFKIRTTLAGSNSSGGTYIFAAFAETPTKFALAR